MREHNRNDPVTRQPAAGARMPLETAKCFSAAARSGALGRTFTACRTRSIFATVDSDADETIGFVQCFRSVLCASADGRPFTLRRCRYAHSDRIRATYF